jgi:hypothetical protein
MVGFDAGLDSSGFRRNVTTRCSLLRPYPVLVAVASGVCADQCSLIRVTAPRGSDMSPRIRTEVTAFDLTRSQLSPRPSLVAIAHYGTTC